MAGPIYLDSAATTPVRDEVREAMLPFLRESFGNPSSPHSFGRAARSALDAARRTIADVFGIASGGVVFTSGGTEADNLAVVGGALAAEARGSSLHCATPPTEHKAVLAGAHEIARRAGRETTIGVDGSGLIAEASLAAALEAGAAVVSVMWVNNETGVVQDVPSISRECAAAGVTFHTDAVQALGKIPCTGGPSWDLLSLSGHKIGAAKGIGALLLRSHDAVAPLTYGGGQQGGTRSGTENVAGAVGLARAVELAAREADDAGRHMTVLRTRLEGGIRAALPEVLINGEATSRAPHICNISLPGTDSESLLMHLDLAGIACASGSACDTGAVEPSHVLLAMGVPRRAAVGSLRFSFMRSTGASDVDRVLDALPGIVERVRSLAKALGRDS